MSSFYFHLHSALVRMGLLFLVMDLKGEDGIPSQKEKLTYYITSISELLSQIRLGRYFTCVVKVGYRPKETR